MGDHAFMSPSFAHIGYRCAAAALRSFQVKQRMDLLREIAAEYYGIDKPVEVQRLDAILKEDTVQADEGTALHTVFETALGDTSLKRTDVLKLIMSHPDMTKGTMSDDYILDQMCEIIKKFRGFIKTCDWHVLEKKVKVRGLPQYGTIDLAAGVGKVLHCKDLKTGRLEVEASDNEQLITYGIGILDEVDMDGVSGWDKYDTVEFEIIGLRWSSEPWTATISELKKFKQEVMLPAFLNAYAINPKATPGDHCKYCAGKIHCGAWQDKVGVVANETFGDEDIRDLNNDKLVELWKLCKSAETLMKQQLGPEIMQRFDGFDPPVGIKRVSGKRNVTFTIPEEELVKKYRSKLKSPDDLYKKDLKTPLQIKSLLKLKDEELNEITKTVQYSPYLQG